MAPRAASPEPVALSHGRNSAGVSAFAFQVHGSESVNNILLVWYSLRLVW